MRSSLLRITVLSSIIMSSLSGTLTIWAAETAVTQKIHHFSLIGADTTKVGEAIDITVEARDKDDKIIPKYTGSIFFGSSDYNATLPLQGRAIQFTESDNGVKKFSKAVIFKKVGDQTIEVSDAVEDASGKKTIKVTVAETTTNTGTTDTLTIITPENDSILNMGDLVTVSGYGKKNSKVNIKVNGTSIATVVADENGLYTKTLPTLSQQSNIVVVELLDGTNKVTATSQVRFSLSSTDPIFNSIVITPSNTVEAGTGVSFLVDAEPGLTEANVNLDGSIIVLRETTAGKYTGSSPAPARPGAYPLSVSLKNSLSQAVTKSNVANLTVTEKKALPTPKFTNVKTETVGTKVIFQFSLENPPADLSKFKIAYGPSAESLSEQVLTQEANTIMNGSGEYSWYIDNLEPKSYSFRIFGVKEDQSLIANLTSEPISATIGTPSCTIANVGDITVDTMSDKSILSWQSVTGAVSYNLYKFTAAGDPEFLKNTTETQYVIFLASGSVVHEDFGVKALCDDKTESPDISKASRVQTGPGLLGFLIVIASIIGILIMRRRVG